MGRHHQPRRPPAIYDVLVHRVPGGLVTVPFLLGVCTSAVAPQALDIGSLTTALFRDGAVPLMALLLFSSGTQLRVRRVHLVAGKLALMLAATTVLPGLFALGYGYLFGWGGVAGIPMLTLLVTLTATGAGQWLTISRQLRGSEEDSYVGFIVSKINSSPFAAVLLICLYNPHQAPPWTSLLATVAPLLVGLGLATVDPEFRRVFQHADVMVLPVAGYALGAQVDPGSLLSNAWRGVAVGTVAVLASTVLAGIAWLVVRRRFVLGFAAGPIATSAGILPALVAQADHRLVTYAPIAAAQANAAVVWSTLLVIPLVAWARRRSDGGPQVAITTTAGPATSSRVASDVVTLAPAAVDQPRDDLFAPVAGQGAGRRAGG